MAFQTRAAKAAIKAAVDAVVDTLDTGTGANPRVRVYQGTQPASADAGVTGSTLLVEFDLGTGAAFGAATTGTGGSASYIVADMAGGPYTATATASGTAQWARGVNKGTVAKIDGDVGTSTGTADFAIDNTTIAASQTVTLNSWRVRQAYK